MALYSLLRPAIFALDAEKAHRLTIAALKLKPAGRPVAVDPVLATRVAGLDFPSPVGLAAGFDKDAEVFAPLLGLGFGFVEVGTLTPRPQAGNPKPRLFRLAEDEAVINRMGFNNGGQDAAAARLARRQPGGIVGINIGANKDSADRIADYAQGVRAMAPLADYLTVNISSPNTPGLRALQDKGALTELLAAVVEARGAGGPPIFLKVAPDLEPMDVQDIADVVIAQRLDALIVSNTTISRPPLRSRYAKEMGGLSGAPLKPLALKRLRDFRRATEGQVPLIAAGGIASGADAWARIKAGASLVQLYSALVFHGPGLVRRIAEELRDLAQREGFANIAEAVGSEERNDRLV
ncbi:MAG: quinone-dependent dihydroorotate dehydrogenase [Allosphingosinicella sp.]|uniref:quinone-dependent dihydroorotate dehydrogenase n=1 Tax=Allosphingosinicella sp. TaxID=2823234 RepID=UPI00392C072D